MFTEMHSHVIWGVDDGAEKKAETFRMLKEAAEDGIGKIICTPHATPGVYEFPEEKFLAHFAEAEEFIRREGLDLKLYMGAENLYTDNTPRLLREGRVMTLAGTKYVLVEFSPTDSWERICNALQKVAGCGHIPVIAHMERYPAIRKTEQVREIRSRFRARVQINARSLTRRLPLFRRRFINRLFREGLVDFVATDTHAAEGRGTCMTAAMKALREKYGEAAEKRILENAELLTGC